MTNLLCDCTASQRVCLIGSAVVDGVTRRVEIRSEAGARLWLANPVGVGPVLLRRAGAPPQRLQGRILELATTPGETLEITPA